MSSRTNRPRRQCRDHIASSQPDPSISSIRPTTSGQQRTPIIVQPSPRITVRSQSRFQGRDRDSRPISLTGPLNSPSVDAIERSDVSIENNDILTCPLCAIDVTDHVHALYCEQCHTWIHSDCLFMSDQEYFSLSSSSESWFCDHCRSIRANRLKWGNLVGEVDISSAVSNSYEEIVTWRKNLFSLPRGKAGTDLIKELTRLIYLFANSTSWQRVSLSLVHIFLPIMLQKPSKKSKAKDHVKYLTSRLEKWSKGQLNDLMDECREIQKRIVNKSQAWKAESKEKAFVRLMLEGKLRQASKFIKNDDQVKGVHKVSEAVKQALSDKHPIGELPHPDVMLPITAPPANQVIFEQITSDLIQKSSKDLSGSGGPTLVDADIWKHLICSRAYGNSPKNLAESIALLARRLCTEEIHHDSLREFTACRLIPLDKGSDQNGLPGIRPIGIGEVLRRIVGKSVMAVLKADIQSACGCLQTCTGIRSGIEAAIHAASEIWKDDATECLLQVDADNAFNRLNRRVALHNIQEICPPMRTFLHNHYQKAVKLTLSDGNKHDWLLSDEGSTQGDPAAMAFYALGITPLIKTLSDAVDQEQCKQSWFADDSSAAGKLRETKKWWETLLHIGPKYGYYPKAIKTVLIIKDHSLLDLASELFAGTGVQITLQGQRHLGATIGNENFKNIYVSKKVEKWVKDVNDLAKIAVDEPQVGLSAYTKSICHRWTFVQRTISDTSSLFTPLENCLRESFIPSIIGRQVSDLERKIISLPVRYGGLGIANPVENADREYLASLQITRNLSNMIIDQQQDITAYDHENTALVIKQLKSQKEASLLEKFNQVKDDIADPLLQRCLLLNKEKGAGSWLTALPLKSHDYRLNKQEFRDAICLRYGWKIPNTPKQCGCGAANSVNHTLICAKGGFVAMRHNALRDLNAEMQREVCKDVVIEPQLLPLDNESVEGTSADRAAPDISSRGMWSTFERTFFDVRVLHPNAKSYINTVPATLFSNHEKEKMRKYNSRVITVEGGSFTPLVYSTFGGWAPQAVKYHKRLAQLISNKRNENYKDVINHIRTRVRFSLLRSVLVAVRGERGRKHASQPLSSVAFNMVPEAMNYECF